MRIKHGKRGTLVFDLGLKLPYTLTVAQHFRRGQVLVQLSQSFLAPEDFGLQVANLAVWELALRSGRLFRAVRALGR